MNRLLYKISAVLLIIMSQSLTNSTVFAFSKAPVESFGNRTVAQQQIVALLKAHASNPRNKAILNIAGQMSTSDIQHSVTALETHLTQQSDDTYAKIYYGYGLLFMATDFLRNKNYMRAAELSKQGFFYMDEAAESKPDDWRLRFLRARMDAFVPAKNGRCVIALKDIAWLEQSQHITADLRPLLSSMKTQAQQSCKVGAVVTGSANPEQTARATNKNIPFLTVAEISTILRPILGEKT